MPAYSNIKRFLSGLLLIVFAVSITPKRFLHNVFAKHVDNKKESNNDRSSRLGIAGYNCDTDNLVAESAFIHGEHSFSFPSPVVFSSYILRNISFTSSEQIYSCLRGPPVNI